MVVSTAHEKSGGKHKSEKQGHEQRFELEQTQTMQQRKAPHGSLSSAPEESLIGIYSFFYTRFRTIM